MRSRKSILFLAVALLPLLFVLQNAEISEPLHQATLTVFKPALVAGQTLVDGAAAGRDWVVRFWQTFRRAETSEARIAELEAEVLRLEEAGRENERLRALLTLKQDFSSSGIAARVIGRDPSPWRHTVLLDRGSEHGIARDMAVMVPGGLVGRILEVGPVTSRAILLTDPDARVGALTDTSREQGVVAGSGGPKLKLQYLELDGGASVGETVLASGIGGLFPKGVPIGKIESVSRASDGLHLEAEVKPFAAFSKLEEVLCVTSSPRK